MKLTEAYCLPSCWLASQKASDIMSFCLPAFDDILYSCLSRLSVKYRLTRCRLRFFFFDLYTLLYLAALGLRCCTQAFSSCGQWIYSLVAVRRLLAEVASLTAEHRLQAQGLISCGWRPLESAGGSSCERAQLLHCMWDLPRPGIKLVSPELVGSFLPTMPPGKAPIQVYLLSYWRSVY